MFGTNNSLRTVFGGLSSNYIGHSGFPVSLSYFTALPDPSSLTSSTATLLFKTLLKRDATTKEKSLNELVTLVENGTDSNLVIDDTFVIAWIQLYAKLATDNARNVRSLSHRAQAAILQKFGGKPFAKYLQTCVPIWLLGSVDPDRTVRRETDQLLLKAFVLSDRVDKLWNLFEDQILTFINNVATSETHESLSDARYTKEEDLVARYDRLLNSSILILIKLIKSWSPTNNRPSSWSDIDTLLQSDTIWDEALQRALKTQNTAFLGTILMLLESIFSPRLADFRSALIKHEKVFKTALKKFFKRMKLKSSPLLASIIIQLWSTLTALTAYLDKFWDISDKGNSKFESFLKIGPLNLDPAYYLVLANFFSVLKKSGSSLVDFNDPEEAEELLVIIGSEFNLLRPPFQVPFIECIFRVASNFRDAQKPLSRIAGEVLEKAGPSVFPTLVKESGSKFDDCFELYEKAILDKAFAHNDSGNLAEKVSLNLIDKFFKICGLAQSDLSYALIKKTLVGLEETEISSPSMAFDVLLIYITKHFSFENSKDSVQSYNFVEFAALLAGWLEEDFIEKPLELMEAIIKKFPEEDLGDSINDFFYKLQMIAPSKVATFILSIFESLIDLLTEMSTFVDELSNKKNLTGDESKLVVYLSKDEKAVHDILQSSTDNLAFLETVCAENREVSDNQRNVLLDICWKNLNQDVAKKFVNSCPEEVVSQSLFDFVVGKGAVQNKSFEYFNDYGNKYFPEIQIQLLLTSARFDSKLISMGNPLESNILLEQDSNLATAEYIVRISNVGKFVLFLDTPVSNYFAGLISEYIADAIFLNEGGEIELQSSLNDKFLQSCSLLDSEQILSHLTGDKSDDFVLSKIITNADSYNCRLLSRLLAIHFDNNPPTFGSEITKLPPLQLAATLLATSEFLNQAKFERLRNYVASEILGVRAESKILTEGLKWVSLAINFTKGNDPYQIFPPHRLAMILNQVQGWLDSSIAYEATFIPMRIQLAQLLNGLLDKLVDAPEKLLDLAVYLAHDNLQVALLENDIPLRYFTLKLLVGLQKVSKNSNTDFDEEVLELLTSKTAREADEVLDFRPISLLNDMYLRYFRQTSSVLLLEKNRENLYALFDSKFVAIQRTGSNLLRKLIIETQKEFVVEYELSKQKLEDDSEPLKAELPRKLVELSSVEIDEYIEFESPAVVTRYVWSWALIFEFFNDITPSIRSSYTSQLNIGKLLHFIFDQVDISKNDILEEIKQVDLAHYDPSGMEFLPEIRTSLIMLYYKILEHFASQAQTWYNGIRDRQLKNEIEKFTSKNISPLLINDVFENLANMKAPDDENMVLKINKVLNEVSSIYTIDDQKMEMVIKIPFIYPLEKVTVEGPLRLGVKENQWRAWLLALQRVISLENGSIMEAIELFNKNVNLHFLGFEDCAICYSILHQDHSLPSKNCPTCNNKFHAACLYKWFKSSGSSTCPLCRSTFSFSRK